MKTTVYYSLNNHVKSLVEDIEEKKEIKTIKSMPKNKIIQMIVLGYKASTNKYIGIEKIDISSYDEIDLYTPIWAGKIALPTLTFLNENDFTNKKVNVFLNAGGGFGQSEQQIKDILKGSLGTINFITNKK